MQESKLTVRVPQDLIDNAKRYASEHDTTLTKLIEAYLRRIPVQEALDNAPIVRRLSGSLSKNVSVDDTKKHLADKYGR